MIVLLAACSGGGSAANGGAPDSGEAYYPDKDEGYLGEDIVVDTVLPEDRKIIKTVNETLQTDDYDSLIAAIEKSVVSLGGYISSANYSGESYYNKENLRNATLTLRIPADKLGEFKSDLEGRAVVSYYNETANDITGAYISVESRIAVLESEENALLEMLSGAKNTSEMLSIRTMLTEVQSDLAAFRAEKKNYDSKVAYSTVYLTVKEVRVATANNPSFAEEVGTVFSESTYQIGSFFRGLAVFFIGNFLYIIMVLAVAVATIFIVRFIIRKRR